MARRSNRQPLGQHFLHDQSALGRIARAVGASPGARVVEIGPGEGALTELLIAAGADLTVVEIDAKLAVRLRERYPQVQVIQQDVLETDLSSLLGDGGHVVGNLPYYITSPILRRTLAVADRLRTAVFLVQKEVAERVVARKGSRDYGYLSAICQLQAEVELLFAVRPGSFRPPPKVDSAVIRLNPRETAAPEPALIRFLEAAFRQPRKTLLNNLAAIHPRQVLAGRPVMSLRAQQLDVEELVRIWKQLPAAELKEERPSPPSRGL